LIKFTPDSTAGEAGVARIADLLSTRAIGKPQQVGVFGVRFLAKVHWRSEAIFWQNVLDAFRGIYPSTDLLRRLRPLQRAYLQLIPAVRRHPRWIEIDLPFVVMGRPAEKTVAYLSLSYGFISGRVRHCECGAVFMVDLKHPRLPRCPECRRVGHPPAEWLPEMLRPGFETLRHRLYQRVRRRALSRLMYDRMLDQARNDARLVKDEEMPPQAWEQKWLSSGRSRRSRRSWPRPGARSGRQRP
jgi:hypothetical protein